MKFCFLARAGQTDYFIKIAKLMTLKGCQCIFVTQNDIDDKKILADIPDAKIYQLTRYLEINWNRFSYQKLQAYVQEYSEVDFWTLYHMDRFLRDRFSYADAVHFMVGHVDFYREVLSEEQPDAFVDETITTYGSYIAYYLCLRQKIVPMFIVCGRRYDKPTIYIASDPFYSMPELSELPPITQEQRNQAEAYISSYINEKNSPIFMKVMGRAPRMRLKYWLLPARNVIWSFMKRFNNKYNYSYYKYNKSLASPFFLYWNYLRSKRYYTLPDLNRKYYLFPLHMQPEASTIVCASKYENQLFAIDQIAKSIPGDAIVYVKEHCAGLGGRPISFYKQLKKYPNVVLVSPWADTHEMIEKCYAVITLTSTVGFDALLHLKPVYLLGHVFYQHCKGVVKVDDIYLQKDSLRTPVYPLKEDVLCFLYAWLNLLRDGNFSMVASDRFEKQNIIYLCNALLDKMSESRGKG